MNEETLFQLAQAQPPGERAAFLDQMCAGDDALRRPVERLLDAHDHPGSFAVPVAVAEVERAGLRDPPGGRKNKASGWGHHPCQPKSV
jgi:hypothetical protein